jgi:hypothetical protein
MAESGSRLDLICAAIVDRLTFGGNIVETGTDSYRLARTRTAAIEHAADPRSAWSPTTSRTIENSSDYFSRSARTSSATPARRPTKRSTGCSFNEASPADPAG